MWWIGGYLVILVAVGSAANPFAFWRLGHAASRLVARHPAFRFGLPDQAPSRTTILRIKRRDRFGLIGVVLVGAIDLAGNLPRGDGFWELRPAVLFFAPLVAALIGTVLGRAVEAGTEAVSARRVSGVRVSRVDAPVLARYVSPAGWVAAGVGLAFPTIVVGMLTPLVVHGLAGVLAAWLVRQPRLARTASDLAWSDALRGTAVRGLAVLGPVVGILALSSSADAFLQPMVGGYFLAALAGVVVALLIMVAAMAVASRSKR